MPDTAFSRWLRSLPKPNNGKTTSNHNLDFIWLKFYDGWFITVEEKIKGKNYDLNNPSDLSQIQSHSLIEQMLNFASGNKFDISFGSNGRNEPVEYKGHFVIIFQNTNPDDSKWIKINGEEHTKGELLYLLTFGELLHIDTTIPLPILAKELDKSPGSMAFLTCT